MVKAAVIEDGRVINLILVDSLDSLPDLNLVAAHGAGIGDVWDGEKIIAEARSAEEIAGQATARIQMMLNDQARVLRWDDIKSAKAAAAVPIDENAMPEEIVIQHQAVALALWDRKCWATSLLIEREVMAGLRTLPTVDEIMAEMPGFVEP